MIAVKNLQNLNEILLQEELLQAVATHYLDMVSDKNATKLLEEIIKTSKKNHAEVISYLEHDLGKKPLSGGLVNKGGKK
ncbi:MAG: hypothetical protein FWC00_00240 [Firmicutes bacterium]|nr:hypothetical protein [Bacillota bacterium]